jgi:hypothetical protein
MRMTAVLVFSLLGCAEGGQTTGGMPDAMPAPALTPDAGTSVQPDALPKKIPTRWSVTLVRPEGIMCPGTMLLVIDSEEFTGAGSWSCAESELDALVREMYGPAANVPRVSYGGGVAATLGANNAIHLRLVLTPASTAEGDGTIIPPEILAQLRMGGQGPPAQFRALLTGP